MREAGKGAGASLRGKKGTFYIIRKVECPLSGQNIDMRTYQLLGCRHDGMGVSIP